MFWTELLSRPLANDLSFIFWFHTAGKSFTFSSPENIKKAEKRLSDIRPGILKSLEKEHITLFPKVYKRLKHLDMMPNSHRFAGKIINRK